MARDYIPRNDEAFDTFFKVITQYVGTKTSGTSPAWTHIPQPRITALNADYAAWYTAFANTFKPHSSVETNEKNHKLIRGVLSLAKFYAIRRSRIAERGYSVNGYKYRHV
jgi:hypothetical protein